MLQLAPLTTQKPTNPEQQLELATKILLTIVKQMVSEDILESSQTRQDLVKFSVDMANDLVLYSNSIAKNGVL